ncbi:MAG: MBL fold metallo-hydrolase [Planctomycetota bacterium]
MIVASSRDPHWLSNTWLVADRPGGKAVLIDTGGPLEPILARIAELRVEPELVLCTHHHHDHVAHNADYKGRYGCPVCGHASEEHMFGGLDRTLADGEELRVGELRVRALHIPGHTVGQLAFVVDDEAVFTGDTLFRGSVGGTRAPGHADFEALRRSIMDRLLVLPDGTTVYPGHMEPTSIARERAENPFVRLWLGADAPGHERVEAFGRPAELLVEARDYDGGTKCQVRFLDDGTLDVVPGSRVRRPS